MLYEKAIAEKRRITEQISSIEQQLKKFPVGRIFCTRNGKWFKWYRSDGHDQFYIPKRERHLAEQLAAKKYLTYLVEDLKQEEKAIDFYLRHHNSNSSQAQHMLTEMPEYQELLSPYFTPLSQELSEWMNSSYNRNPKYPEQLVHKASQGKWVRSKSEVLIDMALYTNKIPFRYECELQLNGVIIYPDFTIRHPKTGQVYYWEHFGKMDDASYSRGTGLKLQQYIANGIIPSIHLITTYETKNNPLSMEQIERVVAEYFL